MNPRLAVVSLWAEDVPAATRFYRDVIGLRLLFHHDRRPHFDLSGAYLTILSGRPQYPHNPVPERFPILAFAVDHLDSAVERLQQHGVELPWGVEHDGRSRWVMFSDPAGNLIELVEFNR